MSIRNYLNKKGEQASQSRVDPLFQCLDDQKENRTRYLVAYPEATLLPFDEIPGVLDEPVPGSIGLYVAGGLEAREKIEIHAEK